MSNAFTYFPGPHEALSALQPSKTDVDCECVINKQTLSMTQRDTKGKPQVLLFGPLQHILILFRSEVFTDSYQLIYNFQMKSFVTHDLKKCKQEPYYTVGGEVKLCPQYGKQYGDSPRHSK